MNFEPVVRPESNFAKKYREETPVRKMYIEGSTTKIMKNDDPEFDISAFSPSGYKVVSDRINRLVQMSDNPEQEIENLQLASYLGSKTNYSPEYIYSNPNKVLNEVAGYDMSLDVRKNLKYFFSTIKYTMEANQAYLKFETRGDEIAKASVSDEERVEMFDKLRKDITTFNSSQPDFEKVKGWVPEIYLDSIAQTMPYMGRAFAGNVAGRVLGIGLTALVPSAAPAFLTAQFIGSWAGRLGGMFAVKPLLNASSYVDRLTLQDADGEYMDPALADWGSEVSSWLEAAVESMAFDVFAPWIGQIFGRTGGSALVNASISKVLKNTAKTYFKGVAAESAEEGLQAIVRDVTDNILKTIDANADGRKWDKVSFGRVLGNAANEFLRSIPTMATLGLISGGIGTGINLSKIKNTQKYNADVHFSGEGNVVPMSTVFFGEGEYDKETIGAQIKDARSGKTKLDPVKVYKVGDVLGTPVYRAVGSQAELQALKERGVQNVRIQEVSKDDYIAPLAKKNYQELYDMVNKAALDAGMLVETIDGRGVVIASDRKSLQSLRLNESIPFSTLTKVEDFIGVSNKFGMHVLDLGVDVFGGEGSVQALTEATHAVRDLMYGRALENLITEMEAAGETIISGNLRGILKDVYENAHETDEVYNATTVAQGKTEEIREILDTVSGNYDSLSEVKVSLKKKPNIKKFRANSAAKDYDEIIDKAPYEMDIDEFKEAEKNREEAATNQDNSIRKNKQKNAENEFKKTPPSVDNEKIEKVTARIIELDKRAGTNTKIITDGRELPPHVQKDAMSLGLTPGVIRGTYDHSTQTVYINATTVKTDDNWKDLDSLWVHEWVAHGGMRMLLGDDFQSEMTKFFDAVGEKTIRETIKDAYWSNTDKNNKAYIADEYFAAMAEKFQRDGKIELSVMEKIKNFIRSILKKLGITSTTDADIKALLSQAYSALNKSTITTNEVRYQIGNSALPEQKRIPQTGYYNAIKTDDGGLYVDTKGYPTHVQFIQASGIPVDRIVSGGRVVDGVYSDGGARGDTEAYVEQEMAKRRVNERLLRDGFKPRYQIAPQVGTEAFNSWFKNSKVVDDNRKPLVVYRGDYRADKLDNQFKVVEYDEGGSGGIYFTSDPEVASGYSQGKQFVPEGAYDLRKYTEVVLNGKKVSLLDGERRLTTKDKKRIEKLVLSYGENEDTGEPDFSGADPYFGKQTWEDHLRRNGGKYLNTMYDIFIQSGTMTEVEDYFDVLSRIDGVGKIIYDDPFVARSGVSPVYLSLQNPIVTTADNSELISKLTKKIGENDTTLQGLKDYQNNNNPYALALITPEFRDAVKELGYDGIVDVGGALTGTEQHSVYIAFDSPQIKSAIGNSGEFNQNNPDIRFSIAPPLNSSEFKNWFGSSQVVDENKAPTIVFHGTANEIKSFNSMVWASTGTELPAEYASMRSMENNGGANIVPLYMKIEQPFNADLELAKFVTVGDMITAIMEQAESLGVDIDTKLDEMRKLVDIIEKGRKREESGPEYQRHEFWNFAQAYFGKDGEKAILDLFKLLGFDGIMNTEYGEMTYGAFSPNQVKSVYNQGTWNPNDPDIRFSFSDNPIKTLFEEGYIVPDEILEPYKDNEWAEKSKKRNELVGKYPKLVNEAKEFNNLGEFIDFVRAMTPYELSNNELEILYKTQQIQLPSEAKQEFRETIMTDDGLQSILGDLNTGIITGEISKGGYVNSKASKSILSNEELQSVRNSILKNLETYYTDWLIAQGTEEAIRQLEYESLLLALGVSVAENIDNMLLGSENDSSVRESIAPMIKDKTLREQFLNNELSVLEIDKRLSSNKEELNTLRKKLKTVLQDSEQYQRVYINIRNKLREYDVIQNKRTEDQKRITAQHKKAVQDAVTRGLPVPDKNLELYQGEKWAQKELAKRHTFRTYPWVLELASEADTVEDLRQMINNRLDAEDDDLKVGKEFLAEAFRLGNTPADEQIYASNFLERISSEDGLTSFLQEIVDNRDDFYGVGLPRAIFSAVTKHENGKLTTKDRDNLRASISKQVRRSSRAYYIGKGDQGAISAFRSDDVLEIKTDTEEGISAADRVKIANIAEDQELKDTIMRGDFSLTQINQYQRKYDNEIEHLLSEQDKLDVKIEELQQKHNDAQEDLSISNSEIKQLRREVRVLDKEGSIDQALLKRKLIEDKQKYEDELLERTESFNERMTALREQRDKKIKDQRAELAEMYANREAVRKAREKMKFWFTRVQRRVPPGTVDYSFGKKLEILTGLFTNKFRIEGMISDNYTKQIDKLLETKDTEGAIRKDISNFITGEKVKNSFLKKEITLVQIDALFKNDLQKLRKLRSKVRAIYRADKLMNIMENFNEYTTEEFSDVVAELNDLRMEEFTYDQMDELYYQTEQLRSDGRNILYQKNLSRKIMRQNVSRDIVKEILRGETLELFEAIGSKETKEKQKSSAAFRVWAATLRPTRMLDKLGGKTLNKWFVEKVNKATDAEIVQWHRRHEAGLAKMKELGITLKELSRQITYSGVTFSADEVVHIQIGMLNEKSKAALIYGNALQPEIIQGLTSQLTEKESLWGDYMLQDFEENYDRLNQAFIRDKNIDMGKEKAYFPMMRQDLESKDLGIGEEMGKQYAVRNAWGRAYTEKKFTLGRINMADEHQVPIRLGATAIWLEQIDKQEHYINSQELIKDLQYIQGDQATKDALKQKYGTKAVLWLQKYVNDYASPNLYKTYTEGARVSRILRNNMAIAYLSFNMLTVLKQAPSLGFYLREAGPHHIMAAAFQMISHPLETIKMVESMDPQMMVRAYNRIQQELAKTDKNAYVNVMHKVGRVGMKPIMWMDKAVTTIGWLATYNAKIGKGMTEVEAAREAQRVTLETQPSGRAKDLAEAYREGEMQNWLLMFSNQLNQIFNMYAYDLPTAFKQHEWRKFSGIMAGIAISGMSIAFLGGWRPPEDPKDIPLSITNELFMNYLSSISIIGGDIKAGFSGEYFNNGMQILPAAYSIGKLAGDIKDRDIEHMGKDMFRAVKDVGVTVGVPVTIINRSIKTVQNRDLLELLGYGFTQHRK